MDEAQIRAIVQQEMQKSEASSRFQFKSIPLHTHNGIDSPFAFQPIITYVGIIQTCDTPLVLPRGWQFVKVGTGSVQIAHNLYPRGTSTTQNAASQLVFMASTFGAGGATLPVPIITTGVSTSFFPNATGVVEFDWFDANGAAASVDATFSFICVQTNSRKVNAPSYVIT